MTVTEPEFETLSCLANAVLDALSDVAEELLHELERARIVSKRAAKPDVVRMNSTVFFRQEYGAERRVRLVYPAGAGISEGRVSIMTPIGIALIRLGVGQSITWRTGRGSGNS